MIIVAGHYMYVGDESGKDCNRYQAYSASSMEAVLEGPKLQKSNNLCSVSFHHYRSIIYAYRGMLILL